MLVSELETHRRSFPAQPASLSIAEFQQTQVRFCRLCNFWTRLKGDGEREQIPTLTSTIHPLDIKLHSERYPDPTPSQLPDPLQPARSLTNLLTAIAALLTRRQPHNGPLLHSAWTVHEFITEECRILESVHFELGTPTPAAWIQVFETRFLPVVPAVPAVFSAVSALAPRARPFWCIGAWRSGHCRPFSSKIGYFSMESKPSCIESCAWFLSCAFWICLQIAGVRLE